MKKINRRKAIKDLSLSAAMLSVAATGIESCSPSKAIISKEKPLNINASPLKGKINHSVCRWCYNKIPFEEFLAEAKDIGLKSVELLNSEEWPLAQKIGLTCAVATDNAISISSAFNEIENHEKLKKLYLPLIDKAADAGLQKVICFSGNRRKLSDEQGLENCAKGLDVIVKYAEKKNITVIMELLNSKVDHIDYQCDKSVWGVALVDKIGSPNFRLLYDIYHMQIMEGDVIHTIRTYKDYFVHYHTGGVPGRNEINETQELFYPAIMKAILETGYKGFVAQEFIPKGADPIAALREGVRICDV
ncbi:MAG TPA: hydroxypyruvate isomerase [Phaeodactylibacter sp.]|nr:hydroxypyruvate isomerase [Phaeodactylibacter sp.]